ncbi:MAG: cell envelope integrity protein TolA [Burkholderiales bacterium]
MSIEREEPGKVWAGILALAVHAALIGILIFGVSWHNPAPRATEVALWSSLPAARPVRATPPVPPPPEPEVKKPEPEPPKEVVKETPKPKEVQPTQADINLKAKKLKEEQARKEQKEQQRQKEEKLKQQEQLKQAQQERARQEARKRQEQEKADAQQRQQMEAQKQQAAQQAAQFAAQNSLVNDFKGRIQSKIKHYVIVPPDLAGNPQAEFDVTLIPTGEVLAVRLTRSSGNSAYDSAVERAIYKAQPLPLPPDPALFSRFRELHLKFRPNE